MNTLGSLGPAALSTGEAVGGAIQRPGPTILGFVAANLVAAAVAARAGRF